MRRGFTLLELLIGLCVVSLLMLLGGQGAGYLLQQTRMTSAAHDLAAFVNTAKAMSIKQRQTLTISVIRTNETSAWLLELTEQNPNLNSKPLLILDGARYPHVALNARYAEAQLLLFGQRGKLSNGHFEFFISSNKALKLITSYGGGRLRICGKEESVYGYPSC